MSDKYAALTSAPVVKSEPVRYMNRFTGACYTLEQQPDAATDTAVYVPLYAAPQSFGNSEQLNSPDIPDGWIKCSERLPEVVGEYVVYETLNNKVQHDYWNLWNEHGNTFTPFWNHYGDHVTHWQPLPAAPKQESE